MIFRDFFLGFLRVYVLHRAARGPLYGLALLDEFQKQGHALGPGTLYPVLHALEKLGYLARENRVVSGRVRKYYVLTPRGARALAEGSSRIRGLVDEVLEPRGSAGLRGIATGGRSSTHLIRPETLLAQLSGKVGVASPIVIDVRGDGEYVTGHIPGARHMPVDELATRCDELSRRQFHVTYCNMRHRGSARSVQAATLLRQRGRRARALAGGFPAWVAAGYPVERGLPA